MAMPNVVKKVADGVIEGQGGMVIIGAGHCGGRAALTLRSMGWLGAITLIGEEALLPYERPPLSKAILSGDTDLSALQLADAAAYLASDISLRLDAKVHALDRAAKTVVLESGETIPYACLLLATGGAARQLSIPGALHRQVVSLRTHADALHIKSHLKPGSRVILIGGGFIGLEVAATARAAGCSVDVIEGAARLLGRAVPESIAAQVLALHGRHGTQIALGAQPVEIRHQGDGSLELVFADGAFKAADLIVVGVGMLPRTELARQAGLTVEQGIVVDGQLRTSDAAIFAAGDVCQFPSSLSGALIRQETWHNAETQASVVAANMLGAETAYVELPWFWSDQYDHTLQVCGEPGHAASSVTRLTGDDGIFIFFQDAEGRLVGGSGFGPASVVTKDLKIMRKLVEKGARIAPELLQDPEQSLKKMLSGLKNEE